MKNVHRGPRKISKPKHFWPTTKRLVAYLRPWKYGVIIAILLAIASVIFSIISPKILGEATTIIYDGVMKGYREIHAGHHLTSLPIDFHRIFEIGVIVVILYVFSGLFPLFNRLL